MMTEHVVYMVNDDQAMLNVTDCLLEALGLCVIPFNSDTTFLNAVLNSSSGCFFLDAGRLGVRRLNVPDALQTQGFDLAIFFIINQDEMSTVVRALGAGAVDCLEKSCNGQILLNSMQQAHRRLSRADNQSRLQLVLQRIASLTPRESDVLLPLVQGYTSREIAEQLGISVKTVDLYRSRVMRHMQAQTLPELVGMAIAADLVDPLALRGIAVADAAND